MSISATEHHGDDPRTDHYDKSQHFDDEFDDYKAHDDAATEHEHRPDHCDSLNNNCNEQQQDTNSYYSESDHWHDERYDSIGDDDPGLAAGYSEDSSEELDNYSKAD